MASHTASLPLHLKQQQPIPSPLRTLPAEIKNNIYARLLTSKHPIQLMIVSDDDNIPVIEIQNTYEVHLDPSILRVCKSFYREGVAILYGSNVFAALHTPGVIPMFFTAIGRGRCYIRTLDLTSPQPTRHLNLCMRALKSAHWLTHLTISFDQSKHIEPPTMASLLTDWMRTLIATRRKAGQEVGWKILEAVLFYRKPIYSAIAEEEDLDAYEYTLEVRREMKKVLAWDLGNEGWENLERLHPKGKMNTENKVWTPTQWHE